MMRQVLPGVLRLSAAFALCAFCAGCSVYGPASLPKPAPSSPTGLVVSPNSLSMGPGDGASLSASESGYGGSYNEADDCSGIATVSSIGPAQFAVTAVSPGLCTVTVSDTSGNSAKVGVSVQKTIIGGQ